MYSWTSGFWKLSRVTVLGLTLAGISCAESENLAVSPGIDSGAMSDGDVSLMGGNAGSKAGGGAGGMASAGSVGTSGSGGYGAGGIGHPVTGALQAPPALHLKGE
jgi:hypothetical protein